MENYRLAVLQAIAMCLCYSAEQSVSYFEAAKITGNVIKDLLSLKFNSLSDQLKRTIYGLLSLIAVPESLPLLVQQELSRIFNALTDLCDKVLTLECADEERQCEDNLEVVNDSDYYASPLRKVHVLCYAKEALEDIAKKNPDYYKQLEASLTEENRIKLQKAMIRAEELLINSSHS